ncbi:hypothetical protein ACWEDZ_04200 [Streptomyces sp. NPDC005047]
MDYGYCALCRDFHAAQADLVPGQYTRPPVMGGGFMRCCGESLRAWAVYHPEPWEPGMVVRCVLAEDTHLHAMRFCSCGYWHWCRAMCKELVEEGAL